MTETEATSRPKNGARRKPPDGWATWPTARAVAKRLRCTRQHVYKLEKDGSLIGHDGYTNGNLVRRYDPQSVASLEPTDDELAEGSDDDDDELDEERPDLGLIRQTTRLVAELRHVAREAREATQRAYEGTHEPARQLLKLAVEALSARESRIAELEKTVSAMHDEQRDARRDDREFALFERQVAREDERKEQFWRVASEHGPTLVGQIVESFRSGGPLGEWLKKASPEKQARIVQAIEMVIGEEPPAPGSPESASTTASPESEHGGSK